MRVLVAATPGEVRAVTMALTRLGEALAAAGAADPGWAADATAPEETGPFATGHVMAFASVTPALDDPARAWSAIEADFRCRCRALAPADGPLYLLTAYRHVGIGAGSGVLPLIRRLNCLVAEISQETGCFVVDIDRMFADVGADAYAADCHIGTPHAVEAVAREIAATMVETGALDRVASARAVQAVREAVAAWSPSPAAVAGGAEPATLRAAQSRTATPTPRDRFVVTQVMRGKMPPGAVFAIMRKQIEENGVAHTLSRVWGLLRQP